MYVVHSTVVKTNLIDIFQVCLGLNVYMFIRYSGYMSHLSSTDCYRNLGSNVELFHAVSVLEF